MNSATRRVVEAVAAHMFVEPEAALSRSRLKCNVLVRHVSMFVLREHTIPRMSFPEIAREFPGHDGQPSKDHTTVISACARIRSKLDTDNFLASAVEVGRQALESERVNQEQMAMLAKCVRRKELAQQIAVLDEQIAAMRQAGVAAE